MDLIDHKSRKAIYCTQQFSHLTTTFLWVCK